MVAEVLDSIFDIESILSDLDVAYEVKGRASNFKRIRRVAAIDEATSTDLTFCSKKTKNASTEISRSNAGIILHHSSVSDVNAKPNQLLVSVENPRLVFMHLANRLHHSKSDCKRGISQLSFMSENS